ncbi:MAG: hypothetical protein QOH25_1984 [Acidobacteriota bacterium]|jgi:hypothetical protein|nr:hypothetical protein [Acidobacteriota bacterium]
MKVVIVSILCLVVIITSACHNVTSQSSEEKRRGTAKADRNHPFAETGELSKAYGTPVHLADLEDKAIDESSGIVASRRHPDFFWTHNDSGDGPFLYAFDRRGGKRGTWRVTDAKAVDWEDITAGPGTQPGQSFLYVGDIGDNSKERREIIVYRVAEPVITGADADTNRFEPQQTEPAEAIHLRYADGKHDAEALAVHPITGDLYIITKTRNTTSAAAVYKLSAPFSTSTVNTLEKVGDIRVPSLFPGMITGADISPDGRKIILCDYFNAYEMSLPERSGGSFDDLWKQPVAIVRLGMRQQGEAVCYRLDGQAILATSENSPAALIEVETIKR